jgi:DNA-binding transcriptional regulator YbjK
MKLKDMRDKLLAIETKLENMRKKILDITNGDQLKNLKQYENLLNEYSELTNVLMLAQINTVVQEHPRITLNQVYLEKKQLEELKKLYEQLLNNSSQENNDLKKQLKRIDARCDSISKLFDNIILNINVFEDNVSQDEIEREKVSEFVQYLEEKLDNRDKISLSDIPELIDSFSFKEGLDKQPQENELLQELKSIQKEVRKEAASKEQEDIEALETWEDIMTMQKIYVETGSLSKVLEFCEFRKCPFSMSEIEVYINKKFHSSEENSFYDPVEHMKTHHKK